MSEQSDNRQHFAVAALSLWLIGTSPWVAMFRRIPDGAGWLDYAHVALGFVTLLLAITYFVVVFSIIVQGLTVGKLAQKVLSKEEE